MNLLNRKTKQPKLWWDAGGTPAFPQKKNLLNLMIFFTFSLGLTDFHGYFFCLVLKKFGSFMTLAF
jgi:hypothetical protein